FRSCCLCLKAKLSKIPRPTSSLRTHKRAGLRISCRKFKLNSQRLLITHRKVWTHENTLDEACSYRGWQFIGDDCLFSKCTRRYGRCGGRRFRHHTVGIKYDQPGLGFREGDNDPTGFDVDVAKAVLSEMGYEEDQIEWEESPTPQRENMLENGQVDMIFATYSITEERAERV